MKKIERGQALTELVKGSLDYTMHLIRQAFYEQFKAGLPEEEFYRFDLAEIFAGYVIVADDRLAVDEFYRVAYAVNNGVYVFAGRDSWEVVELAYRLPAAALAEGRQRDKRHRLTERIDGALALTEAEKNDPDPDGPWRIRAVGITAGVVNGNGRRYAAHVLEAAVREAQTHLHESAGQGRLILTGEIDHPAEKGHEAALLQETVINWDTIRFDGRQVLLEGWLLGTQKGRDLRAMMKGGVRPDISQRGYGQSVFVNEGQQPVEEVLALFITGYDPVLTGADPNGRLMMAEAKPIKTRQETAGKETTTMDELTLATLREKYPQLVAQIEKERDESRRKELETQLQTLAEADRQVERRVKEKEAALREKLGLGAEEDLVEALSKRQSRLEELKQRDEAQERELAGLRAEKQRQAVAQHLETKLGAMKYPDELKGILAEALKSAQPETVAAADGLIEAKVKEYDAIMAKLELAKRGFKQVEVLGPVLERETGTPEFALASFELTERMVERGLARRRDLRKAVTPNELFTRRYLEAFDRAYRSQLLDESLRLRAWQEAETTADLNLPYTVSRTIIEEAFPELVALSIFDFGLEDMSPSRVYFEQYSGESGAQPSVTDEAFTSAHDSWVQLNYRSLQPGTVTVTSSPAGTTYDEWDDYVLDYGEGKVMVLSTGAMADATAFLIDYTYDAVRRGENAAIQRGKGALSYQTIEMRADRLAGLITDEAITFARSQLGWDAVTRTLNMIIRELREIIDRRAIYLGLTSAVRAANNGGTWSSATISQTTLAELVQKMGAAKVAVMNDHYMPGFFLLSLTNADILSNWDGFARDGFPDAVMNSAGFVGQVKGLPVFQSAQMPDSHALTGHRELVQHRVLSNKTMALKGPYQAYSSGNLVAAQEWYAEEYNATVSLIANKGGFVTIT